MRTLISVMLLFAFALSGCARKKISDSVPLPRARAGAPAANQPLIVTLENAVAGKVALVNTTARFVVLNFPIEKMAAVEQRLNVYRRGLKVGEVKVTGPQREDNIVADLVAGEAEVGDEVRSQ
jgi:hypothetical protein